MSKTSKIILITIVATCLLLGLGYAAIQNITLNITDTAKEFLLEKGTNLKFGARPLRRAIQRHLEDELSEMILRGELSNGDSIKVDVADDKLTFAENK